MQQIGDIICYAGVLIMFIGVFSIFKLKNFFARILIGGVIDTVGAITIIVGIAVKHGFSSFSLKLLLLIGIILLINPLITHILARSAYLGSQNTSDSNNEINEDLL